MAPLLGFDVNDFAGSFTSPFREHLGFGKLTYQMNDDQRLELSGSIRKETDLRDFGGQASRERGRVIRVDRFLVGFPLAQPDHLAGHQVDRRKKNHSS